jgi:hypothetical protein
MDIIVNVLCMTDEKEISIEISVSTIIIYKLLQYESVCEGPNNNNQFEM